MAWLYACAGLYLSSYPLALFLLHWPSAAAASMRRALETHYQLAIRGDGRPAQGTCCRFHEVIGRFISGQRFDSR